MSAAPSIEEWLYRWRLLHFVLSQFPPDSRERILAELERTERIDRDRPAI